MNVMDQASRRRGGALVDATVSVVVIAVLLVVVVGAYKGAAESGRRAAAQRDAEALAAAEKSVRAASGAYVPLQVLNDPAAGAGGRGAIDAEPAAVLAVDATLADKGQAPAEQPAAAALAKSWKGPYFMPVRLHLGDSGVAVPGSNPSDELAHRDFPLDPWGRPYRLYSPLGVVGADAASADPKAIDAPGFSDGKVTTTDDRFDAYAIVSYGADGKSDSVGGGGDDVIYFFSSETPEAGANAAHQPSK